LPALTEAEAADLALFALVRAFEDRGRVTSGISQTHLTKAVFRLADAFDLPITRYWFKFGQYVAVPSVTTTRLAEVRGSGVGPLADRIRTDLRTEFQGLLAEARSLVPFFNEPLNEFLPDYYRREAPEPFRDLYATNFEMITFFSRLPDEEDSRGLHTHYGEIAGPLVTRFHRAAAPQVKDEEVRDLVVEYTSFLEELAVRYDREDPSLELDAWRRFFRKVVDAYQDSIWNLPAAQIARATAVGPRAEEVRASMDRTATLAPRYRREVFEPLHAEAETRGYLPSEEDLRPLLADAQSRTATRAEAIEELAHLARQGD